jgi:hypothetical protein
LSSSGSGLCGPGSFSTAGSGIIDICTPCPSGTFSAAVGAAGCSVCAPGFSAADGSSSCKALEHGQILMNLTGSISDFVEGSDRRRSFVAGLANLLAVSDRQIVIVSVRSGSIIVELAFVRVATSSASPLDIILRLKDNAANGKLKTLGIICLSIGGQAVSILSPDEGSPSSGSSFAGLSPGVIAAIVTSVVFLVDGMHTFVFIRAKNYAICKFAMNTTNANSLLQQTLIACWILASLVLGPLVWLVFELVMSRSNRVHQAAASIESIIIAPSSNTTRTAVAPFYRPPSHVLSPIESNTAAQIATGEVKTAAEAQAGNVADPDTSTPVSNHGTYQAQPHTPVGRSHSFEIREMQQSQLKMSLDLKEMQKTVESVKKTSIRTPEDCDDLATIKSKPELQLHFDEMCKGLNEILNVAMGIHSKVIHVDKTSGFTAKLGTISEHADDTVGAIIKGASKTKELFAGGGSDFNSTATKVAANLLDGAAYCADGIPIASFVLKSMSFMLKALQDLKVEAGVTRIITHLFPQFDSTEWNFVVEGVARRVTLAHAVSIEKLHNGTEDDRWDITNWGRQQCEKLGLATLTSKADDAVKMMALKQVEAVSLLALQESMPVDLKETALVDFIVMHIAAPAVSAASAAAPAQTSSSRRASNPGPSSVPLLVPLNIAVSQSGVEQLPEQNEAATVKPAASGDAAPQSRPVLQAMTAQDVATAIGHLGPPYKAYEQLIVDHNVYGKMAAQIAAKSEAQAECFMMELGIASHLHRDRIFMEFKSWSSL